MLFNYLKLNDTDVTIVMLIYARNRKNLEMNYEARMVIKSPVNYFLFTSCGRNRAYVNSNNIYIFEILSKNDF